MERMSLYYREKLLGSDIKEGFERLVAEDGSNLPLAVSKKEIVNQLMIMSAIDRDGLHHPRNVRDQKTGAERFATDMQTTSVFMAGAELYETATKRPMIPVSDYFFNHVYGNGDTRACLDAMSETEIANSLPRRTALPQMFDVEKNKKVPQVLARRPSDGEQVLTTPSGRIAGVVIFPPGEVGTTGLVAAWAARRESLTHGTMDRFVDFVEHVLGEEDQRVMNLRHIGQVFKNTGRTRQID